MGNELKIGVVGYSPPTKFDMAEAMLCITAAYDLLEKEYPAKTKIVVSGLTDVGIPSLAYREAVRRCWKTVGIACAKISEHKCFPVDEEIIVGKNWGDESKKFLDSIDVLVRVGGGEQSKKETVDAKARGLPVLEWDLTALVS